MLRRLHKDQPASFAFTPANLAWAQGQISKYPEGRQASAIIPLLWRAQEQEGWLSRPAIEYVSQMLGMAYIRGLEVATFYFMFQLQPVGSVAHIQICGTTSCMICGAEDLVAVCKELIAKTPHILSADGKFSWEEVECLGACANAPMAQIGKDYYEDLTPAGLRKLIARFSAGEVPVPGSEIGRYAAEPASGLTSLTEYESGRSRYNASAQLAVELGDTVKRIDGTEVPLTTPWQGKPAVPEPAGTRADESRPAALAGPRGGKADNLKLILGVGPRLEVLCHRLGFYHFDQIAAWTPAEIAWVDANLEGFKGRVTRDKWVAQAKVLAAGGTAEDAERVARN
ncbi:MAG: NADH-quinone oxidoreductase subunit NuoE [Rhodobacter sp.]|nr:NADH-quinone oxidoreductase subunit NuoE [Rhodobacter sp.]